MKVYLTCDFMYTCSLLLHDRSNVGSASDAFELDVILEEFKRMEKCVEDEGVEDDTPNEDNVLSEDLEANETGEEEKDGSIIDRMEGKHYLVMRFQNWSGKSESLNFNAARFCLKSQNSRWFRRNIRQVVADLAYYGLYVTGYAFDGASENRSFIKHTLNMTLEEVLPGLLESTATAPATAPATASVHASPTQLAEDTAQIAHYAGIETADDDQGGNSAEEETSAPLPLDDTKRLLDVVWTCLGVIITASQLLNKFPRAPDGSKNSIIQRHHGTDDCEMLFSMKRNANPNADAKGTNEIIAGSFGTNVMNSIAASTKSNCETKSVPGTMLNVRAVKRCKLEDEDNKY